MDKKLLIIGSSTSGHSALQTILTRLPAAFPVPIVIIPYMPPDFTRPLAEHLNEELLTLILTGIEMYMKMGKSIKKERFHSAEK